MASAASASGAKARLFPLQLAHGVLRDLLLKELDARLAPDDGVKRAAFSASRDSLARRMALLMPQFEGVDGAGAVEGVYALVREQWKAVFGHPLLARIQPSILQPSLWLETFCSVFEAACASAGQLKTRLLEGGALVTAALQGIDTTDAPFSSLPPEKVAQMLTLVEWWGEEVCSKLWGVKDLWGPCLIERNEASSPLHAIAAQGLAAFVRLAVKKGCPVNGDFSGGCDTSPAGVAVLGGHFDVIEALIAHGLDLARPFEKNGWPVGLYFFRFGNGQAAFLSSLLDRWPNLIGLTSDARAREHSNLLGAAILSGDPALVDLVLSAGAEVEYRCRREGERTVQQPSLAAALETLNATIIELVITKSKALEGWRERYDEAALAELSTRLAYLAVTAYPSNPHYKGDPRDLHEHNPHAMGCVERILSSGLVCPWNFRGLNALRAVLYSRDSNGLTTGCRLIESHALAVLKRFHAAGFDVLNGAARGKAGHYPANCPQLQYTAAVAGHPDVMQWCFDELGALPDPATGEANLLAAALSVRGLTCVTLLLDKYNVRVAFPEWPFRQQPVSLLMGKIKSYTEAEAQFVLGALIQRSRSLFDIPCFGEAAVAELERDAVGNEDRVALWNPLFALAYFRRPRTLEYLLQKNLPGIAAMANRASHCAQMRLTPAQLAASGGEWECLDLLLRYTGCRVTEVPLGGLSVADLVRRGAGTVGGPSRVLQATVKARAKKELADKAKTAAASQAAGAVTNAFEEPAAKPLTADEEKAKAKKKAAKKKAKAKAKRRAAVANAGSGGAALAADGSESDDSSSDGDNDDDEDARYAPDFDALKAQMEAAMKKE